MHHRISIRGSVCQSVGLSVNLSWNSMKIDLFQPMKAGGSHSQHVMNLTIMQSFHQSWGFIVGLMDLVLIFSHLILGPVMAIFWRPSVPQSGPMVSIWTLTPNCIIWVWSPWCSQPKTEPGWLILCSYFIFTLGPLEMPLGVVALSWGLPGPLGPLWDA